MEEYSDLDMQQMVGRAGRPQYDTHGQVVVSPSQISAPIFLTVEIYLETLQIMCEQQQEQKASLRIHVLHTVLLTS